MRNLLVWPNSKPGDSDLPVYVMGGFYELEGLLGSGVWNCGQLFNCRCRWLVEKKCQ